MTLNIQSSSVRDEEIVNQRARFMFLTLMKGTIHTPISQMKIFSLDFITEIFNTFIQFIYTFIHPSIHPSLQYVFTVEHLLCVNIPPESWGFVIIALTFMVLPSFFCFSYHSNFCLYQLKMPWCPLCTLKVTLLERLKQQ